MLNHQTDTDEQSVDLYNTSEGLFYYRLALSAGDVDFMLSMCAYK